MTLDPHRQCKDLFQQSEYRALAELVDSLGDGNGLDAAALADMWLWRVDALLSLGDASKAMHRLDDLERLQGVTFASCHRRARLASFLGDSSRALDAASDALMILPPQEGRSTIFKELSLLRTEALLALGRRQSAWDFLTHVIGGEPPSFAELRWLSRTVEDAEDLEDFYRVLARYFSGPITVSRHALYHFSVACRDLGQMDRAIAAARQRFLLGAEHLTLGSKPAAGGRSWTEAGGGALRHLQEDLQRLNTAFFLVSGTLLGCVRDQGLIRHDKDIDVGVMAPVDLPMLKSALSQTGRFKVRPLRAQKMIQLQHANGTMIDIFLHWREGDRVLHEGQKTQWWNTPFELTTASFLGSQFFIPENAELYLNENYGTSWRTPATEFDTFLDTPNMIVNEPSNLILYFYNKLFDYFYAGKKAVMDRVWCRIVELAGPDPRVQRVMDSLSRGVAEGS